MHTRTVSDRIDAELHTIVEELHLTIPAEKLDSLIINDDYNVHLEDRYAFEDVCGFESFFNHYRHVMCATLFFDSCQF